ncbi:hypothetical protein K502DRAFT_146762 [Neoconidiobolus thromboides FSU 785]|nr:hypothetical protein K502DRAFT_146762 [Neoconidiobolus thromboides FSU 785]
MLFNINCCPLIFLLLTNFSLSLTTSFGTGSGLTLVKLSQIFQPCGVENSIAPGESISCSKALPLIQSAASKYSLTTNEQLAFYLSTIAIESGNLSFNKNHFPGRIGQGTYSMLMSPNLYAFYKTEINNNSIQYNENDDNSKAQLLNYLNQNELYFLPGAWWIAKGAGEIQNSSCNSLKNDLVNADTSKVAQLFTTCLGVDGMSRVSAYKNALQVLNS